VVDHGFSSSSSGRRWWRTAQHGCFYRCPLRHISDFAPSPLPTDLPTSVAVSILKLSAKLEYRRWTATAASKRFRIALSIISCFSRVLASSVGWRICTAVMMTYSFINVRRMFAEEFAQRFSLSWPLATLPYILLRICNAATFFFFFFWRMRLRYNWTSRQ